MWNRKKIMRFVALVMAVNLLIFSPAADYVGSKESYAIAPAVTLWDMVTHMLFSSVGYSIGSADDTRALSGDIIRWLEDRILSGDDIKYNVIKNVQTQQMVGVVLTKVAMEAAKKSIAAIKQGAADWHNGSIALTKDIIDVFSAYIADRAGRYTEAPVLDAKVNVTNPVSVRDLIYTKDNPFTFSGGSMISYEAYSKKGHPFFTVVAHDGANDYGIYLLSKSEFVVSGVEKDGYHHDINCMLVSRRNIFNDIVEVCYSHISIGFDSLGSIPIPYHYFYDRPIYYGNANDVLDYFIPLLYPGPVSLDSSKVVSLPDYVDGNVVTDESLVTREWEVIEGGAGENPDEEPKPPYVPLWFPPTKAEDLPQTAPELQEWIDEQNQQAQEDGLDNYVKTILPDSQTNPDVYPGSNPNPDPGTDPDPGIDPDPGVDPNFDLLGNIKSIIEILKGIGNDIKSIPGQITDFFTIDTAAISVAYGSLADTFQSRFSGLSQISALFNFGDRNFEESPPVIMGPVPEPLKFAIQGDTMVWMDLRPFATQLKWCRFILTAAIWVLFIKWLLDQFDVKFTIG